MWGDIAIAFLLAFITAFVLTPYTMRLAKKVGAIDVPNDRRVNKKPMPRLGGIAVIAGFLVSAIYLIITMRIENNIDFITDGLGNKKPMPRLRRDSSYLWIYSIYNILVNCNEFRRLNKYI